MSGYCQCPRCGSRTFEQLQTYSHCANCFYYEDRWSSAEEDYYASLRAIKEIEKTFSEQDLESVPVVEIENKFETSKLKGA